MNRAQLDGHERICSTVSKTNRKKGKNWMRRMILFAYVVKEKVTLLKCLKNSILIGVFLHKTVTSSCSSLQEERIEVFMKKG